MRSVGWARRATVIGSALALGLVGAVTTAPDAEAVRGGASNSFARFYCWKAYNTSKKDGPFDTKDTLHYDCQVKDIAKDNRAVYLQYKGYRNNLPDTGWKRLTKNARGYGWSLRQSGTVTAGTLTGWQIRACRSIPKKADQCTGWLYVPD